MNVELIYLSENAALQCESAARMCYDSASKTCEGSAKKLLGAVVNKGHLSVLEFGYATFKVEGVSRALLAQITRHRHLSFNVRSQRYVREDTPQYVVPPALKGRALRDYCEHMEKTWEVYSSLLAAGVRPEDARFVLPNACYTQFHVSGNLRAWKEWLPIRTDRAAQWEIRELAVTIESLLKKEVPEVF